MTKEPLNHFHLEAAMHDLCNMSELACEQLEGAGHRVAGGTLIADADMNMVSFCVTHVHSLAIELKRRWNELHDSQVAAAAERPTPIKMPGARRSA